MGPASRRRSRPSTASSRPTPTPSPSRGCWECNWLQALEVGIDPAHASYLHRFFEDEDRTKGYGKQFRDGSTDSEMPMTQVLREHDRPEIAVERTEYGLRDPHHCASSATARRTSASPT